MLGRVLAPLRSLLANTGSVTTTSRLSAVSLSTRTRLSEVGLTATLTVPGASFLAAACRGFSSVQTAVTPRPCCLLSSMTKSTSLVVQTRSVTLETLHKRLQNPKIKVKKRPLDGKPQMKGVVLKTLIKKPKKPNSANRRCVLVRLSNGKEMVAYVPGEGHNLQEHNIVLCRVGRLRDTPGVKIKCIRGKYDLSHVIKKTQQ